MNLRNAWKFLELDPQDATSREVRRAYATLLKRYRPDEFPEEFQQLRDAYAMVMAALEHKSLQAEPEEDLRQQDEEVVSGHQPKSQSVSINSSELLTHMLDEQPKPRTKAPKAARVSFTPEAQAAYENLLAALQQQDEKEIRSAYEAFSRTCADSSAQAQLWASACMRLMQQTSGQMLIRFVTLDEWRRDLGLADGNLANFMVSQYQSAGDADQLYACAMAALRDSALLEHSEAVQVVARLAVILAFRWPQVSNNLAGTIFMRLPFFERQRMIAELEHRTEARKAFGSEARWEVIDFWDDRLNQRKHPWDWKNAESTKMWNHLAKHCLPTWSGFPFIRGLTPYDWGNSLWQKCQKNRKWLPLTWKYSAGKKRKAAVVANTSKGKGFFGNIGGWARFAWILVLVLPRLSNLMSTTPYQKPSDPPPARHYQEVKQETLEEINRETIRSKAAEEAIRRKLKNPLQFDATWQPLNRHKNPLVPEVIPDIDQ